MAARAPRYLLREFMVNRLLDDCGKGRFLELGYGAGDMLINLAAKGYLGCAYDPSAEARSLVEQRFSEQGIRQVELLDQFPDDGQFDYVMFFELIGYIDDPGAYLRTLRDRLEESGRVVFSFTNIRHKGTAEERTGGMECFSREEIEGMLDESGFRVERMVNYGFPLSNVLRPLLHLYHRLKTPEPEDKQVARSGLNHVSRSGGVLRLLLNRYTLLPFSLLQLLFSGTDLGTGYIVVARPQP